MASGSEFRMPHFGRERLQARSSIPRHRHRDGYIAVVLAGGYQEAGFAGRLNLRPGDVVVHRRYDAHVDHVGTCGAELINLPLPPGLSLPAAFRIADPDAVARHAESDPIAAAALLQPAAEIHAELDWVDQLAAQLVRNPGQRLYDWAMAAGLAPATLSRGFRLAYGVGPARFRREARAYAAMAAIERSREPLAAIAADCGFADQAHLTRTVVELTGRPPGAWRTSNLFKRSEGSSPKPST